MAKQKELETKASILARDILAATQGDWLMAARELKAQAKNNSELLREIVEPLISDRIWQAVERVTPINMGGGSLLNCPLSATEHCLLGLAKKADLEKEIAFFVLHARTCLKNIGWLETVAGELEEGQTVREKFTAESIVEFRQQFEKEWQSELAIETPERKNPIRKLAIEALQINKGEWFLALQSLTQRVTTDSQALYYLTSPVLYTMVWTILSRASEKKIDMNPPLNYTLSTGWVFGDSTIQDINEEIALWEDAGRYYLRKVKWLELIKEATGDDAKAQDMLTGAQVKKLWGQAFQSV